MNKLLGEKVEVVMEEDDILIDSQLGLKNQSAARGGGCGVKRRPN